MKTTTITSKGTATIPKEIRDILQLREGSKINFIVEAGKIIIERALTLEEVREQNGKYIKPELMKLSVKQTKERAETLKIQELKKKYSK